MEEAELDDSVEASLMSLASEGTVSVDWQTVVVVPIFKKGDWRGLKLFGDHTPYRLPGTLLKAQSGGAGGLVCFSVFSR